MRKRKIETRLRSRCGLAPEDLPPQLTLVCGGRLFLQKAAANDQFLKGPDGQQLAYVSTVASADGPQFLRATVAGKEGSTGDEAALQAVVGALWKHAGAMSLGSSMGVQSFEKPALRMMLNDYTQKRFHLGSWYSPTTGPAQAISWPLLSCCGVGQSRRPRWEV